MSLIRPDFDESVIVRSAEAEVIGQAPITVRRAGRQQLDRWRP
ncbi:MAG: hypothetical protein JWP48_5246 [Actinoallomurus sp.]|jgi:hypothetical protein|nr:hypothetical protein [Actinoallomurus sp.]